MKKQNIVLIAKPLKFFTNLALVANLIIIFFASIVIFLQLSMLQQVYLSPAVLKMLAGGVMMVAIGLLVFVPHRHRYNQYLCFPRRSVGICISYFVFLVLSFTVVMLKSFPEVGFSNAIGAFQYNQSLSIFMLPFSLLIFKSFEPASPRDNQRYKWLFSFLVVFVLSSSVLQCLQLLAGEPILLWNDPNIMTLAFEQAYIKFDQISGIYRSQGLFRSPLEAGIVGVGIVLLSMIRLLEVSRKGMWLIVFLIASVGCLSTGSRSVYLLYVASVGSLAVLCYCVDKNSRTQANKNIPMLLLLSAVAVVSSAVVLESKIGTGLLNPTNLLIRLDNWHDLIGRWLHSTESFLFGLGIVQNGKYGDYHSVVIDNTLIGLFLNVGALGAILALFVLLQWSREVIARLRRASLLASLAMAAYIIGFVLASNFENLMHISYYPIAYYFFVRLYIHVYSPQKLSYSSKVMIEKENAL